MPLLGQGASRQDEGSEGERRKPHDVCRLGFQEFNTHGRACAHGPRSRLRRRAQQHHPGKAGHLLDPPHQDEKRRCRAIGVNALRSAGLLLMRSEV